MLWALGMKSGRQYSQVVKEGFHLTMACLDVWKTADDHPIQVMVIIGGSPRRFVLCTLDKKNVWQAPLNLHIEKRTFITFLCNGRGRGYIDLTGYYKDPTMMEPNQANILSAHIKEGTTTACQLAEYIKRDKKITLLSGIYGNEYWMVQDIPKKAYLNRYQENEMGASSKRKASFPEEAEDEAPKRMKPSADSNENRSNNDNCDKNIENLDEDENDDAIGGHHDDDKMQKKVEDAPKRMKPSADSNELLEVE